MKNKTTLDIVTIFLLLFFLLTAVNARSEINQNREAGDLADSIWKICKNRPTNDLIMDCGEFLNNCTINKSLPWKREHFYECVELEKEQEEQ